VDNFAATSRLWTTICHSQCDEGKCAAHPPAGALLSAWRFAGLISGAFAGLIIGAFAGLIIGAFAGLIIGAMKPGIQGVLAPWIPGFSTFSGRVLRGDRGWG